MADPLCRCGREKHRHQIRLTNWYSAYPLRCRAYDPMDFAPFDQQLSGEDGMGCHCDLCDSLRYAAHGRPGLAWVAAANVLYDALLAGTHVYRGWVDRPEHPNAASSAV